MSKGHFCKFSHVNDNDSKLSHFEASPSCDAFLYCLQTFSFRNSNRLSFVDFCVVAEKLVGF